MNTPRRLLRLPAIISMTGLGRDTLYRLMAEGTFPRQVQISAKAVGWYSDEVDEWIASRPRVETSSQQMAALRRRGKARPVKSNQPAVVSS